MSSRVSRSRPHRSRVSASSALEKRPTFTFHRCIRDHPVFTVELPSSPLHQYAAVTKSCGGAIHDLVQEWTEEWLAGVGGADAEARLRGMVEEVVWGNVIWYGIGGWASCGTGGCGFTSSWHQGNFLPLLLPARRRRARRRGWLLHSRVSRNWMG